MNYAGIKYCDIANGLGCRTVLFVSGCRNACKMRKRITMEICEFEIDYVHVYDYVQ